MGVPPEQLPRLVDVPVTYVDAAGKSNTAICNNNLAVITVIDPIGQQDKMYLIKRERLHSGVYHLFNKGFADRMTAKVVINKPHLDALQGLLNQDILQLSAN